MFDSFLYCLWQAYELIEAVVTIRHALFRVGSGFEFMRSCTNLTVNQSHSFHLNLAI